MTVTRLVFSVLASLVFTTPLVGAQQSSPQSPSKDSPSPLSGPSVKEPGVPGNSTTFTGGGRREGERVIDHRTFLKALDTLRSAPDAALHLNADQEAQLFILFRDFRIAQRAYFEKNLNDIRDVRQVLEIRGDLPPTESSIRKGVDELRRKIVGDEGATDEPMSDAAVKEAAREKARRIYEGAPRAGSVHVKVWKLLTPPQRDALNDIINTLVAQQEAQRREFLSPESVTSGAINDVMNSPMANPMNGPMNAGMNGSMNDGMTGTARKRTADQRAESVTPATAHPNDPASLLGMDPAKISPTDPRLPERVRRRLRGMKAEAQAEALSRYLVDLKEELAEAKAAASKDKSTAPTVDKVNIPTPEKK